MQVDCALQLIELGVVRGVEVCGGCGFIKGSM